jgi:hypothetical protein
MTARTLFKKYFEGLAEIALRGDAREESFYAPLAETVRELAVAGGKTQVAVTTLPKSTDAGNPDFRVWNGADRIIGYIEAKVGERRPSVEERQSRSGRIEEEMTRAFLESTEYVSALADVSCRDMLCKASLDCPDHCRLRLRDAQRGESPDAAGQKHSIPHESTHIRRICIRRAA